MRFDLPKGSLFFTGHLNREAQRFPIYNYMVGENPIISTLKEGTFRTCEESSQRQGSVLHWDGSVVHMYLAAKNIKKSKEAL